MDNSEQSSRDERSNEPGRFSENLAFLYQGLLTIVVRMQAGREQIPEAQIFRERVKNSLLDAERDAKRVGYEADDIRAASLAVIAFLDSVVLHSMEDAHAEWVRQSLAQDLLQVANAGEVFFDELSDLLGRRNSPDLADVLEVYALCLLLGFEGRYSERQRAELNAISDKVRRRIEEIRGKTDGLSPTAAIPEPSIPLAAPAPVYNPLRRYIWLGAGVLAAVLLCFVLLKIDLIWAAHRTAERIF